MNGNTDTNHNTRWLAASMLMVAMGFAFDTHAQNAEDLLARHAALQEPLINNPYGRPLHLESSQSRSRLEGEIYAEINQSYTVVGPALHDVKNWCDILILHLNTKSCRAFSSSMSDTLSLHIGRKTDQPLTSAQPIDFEYNVISSTPDYLQVSLAAKDGPLGTSDYHIMLEATALNASESVLHLSYSYDYNMMAKLAMQSYLATIGRNKIGFSVVGHDSNGKPEYANGMRGVIERNTMRYYLAIDAYLGALAAPPSQQIDKRLNDWFTSSERYPLQLHEIDRNEYLAMKHEEIRRQSSVD
jgi:hypothetical protein